MNTKITISFDDNEILYDEAIESFNVLKKESKSVRKFIGEPKAYLLNGRWVVSQEIRLNLRTIFRMYWIRVLDFIK